MFWLLSTTRRTMVPSSKRLAGAASFGVLRLSMLWGTPIPRSRRLLAATRRTRPTTAQRGQKFGSRGLRRLHRCTCSGSVTSGYDDATAPDCRCKGDMVGFLKAPGPRFVPVRNWLGSFVRTSLICKIGDGSGIYCSRARSSARLRRLRQGDRFYVCFVGLQRKVPIVLRETAAMLTHRHVANRAGHDIPQRMAGQTS